MPRRTVTLDRPLDLVATVAPHLRGRGDPAMQLGPCIVVRATRTLDGPATLHVRGSFSVMDFGSGGATFAAAAGSLPYDVVRPLAP